MTALRAGTEWGYEPANQVSGYVEVPAAVHGEEYVRTRVFYLSGKSSGSATFGGEIVIRLTRPEVSQSPTEKLVLKAVRASDEADFRTRDSIRDELGLSDAEVDSALERLKEEGLVRAPVSRNPAFANWVRDTSRGLTRGERWNWFRAVASRS